MSNPDILKMLGDIEILSKYCAADVSSALPLPELPPSSHELLRPGQRVGIERRRRENDGRELKGGRSPERFGWPSMLHSLYKRG